jgi:hypothetical protein
VVTADLAHLVRCVSGADAVAVLMAAADRTDMIPGAAIPTEHGELWLYTDAAVVAWLHDLATRVDTDGTEVLL